MISTSEQQSNKYQLKTQLSQSGLQIKMVEKQNEMGQCYAATILHLSQYQKLKENFDSPAELITYLTQGNYQFCSSTGEFKIIVKVNSSKSKIIELARLQMVYSQPDLSLALQQLCQRCSISTQNNATSLVLSLAKIVKLSIQKQQKRSSKDNGNTAKKQEQYDTRLGQIRQTFEVKIDQLYQQIERVHSEMQDQIQKLSHQLSKIQPQVSANPSTTSQQSANKTEQQNWNKHYKPYRSDKESRLDEWINLQFSSPNLKKYEGNRIASSNSYSTRMFSNFVVDKAYKFGIMIQELGDVVDVGVVSKANRSKNSLYTEKNSDLFVVKSDGTYYDGKSLVTPPQTDRKNIGFTQGDIVDVFINLQAASIEWSVKGQVKLSLTNYRLQNPETKWVVYVRLGKKCCVKLFL